MDVLVTGGGGFLGKNLCRALIERGDTVRSISRSRYPELEAMGVRCFSADLAQLEPEHEALAGVDAIVHTAACVGMWGPYDDFYQGNVTATERLLAAAQTQSVRALVFTSSPSVTFDGASAINGPQDLPYPKEFLAFYPQTKAKAEAIALAANDATLRTVSLRPHLIYGPGDPHLIPRLLARARAGRLRIVGKGDNVVDLTYIDNAVAAHINALDALTQDDAPSCAGKPYFISDDAPVVLWDWLNTLFERVGLKPVTKKVPFSVALAAGAAAEASFKALNAKSEPPMTRFIASQLATSHWYDMAPAKQDLGYAPPVSSAQALDRLVEDIKARGL